MQNTLSDVEVKELVKNLDVRFIRLQFSDILGIIKNVAIPVEQLEKALAGEIMFDGSSIEGFVRIEESDMYLKPDPATFTILPWKPTEGTIARMICDIYTPEGDPFSGCPRFILKKAIAAAKKTGFTMYAGPEPEFFIFHKDENDNATTTTHEHASYFDLAPLDLGEHARRDMVIALEKMGFNIETCHHEVAPGQHEIDFKYDNALYTADKITTFRFVIKTIAAQHNLHATFMPKPVYGISGSGMHIHQSLFKKTKNAFYGKRKQYHLSKTALYYIGGLIKHARGFTAITNPLINSYKRLVPGYESPVYISWSERNRSPLIRVPAVRGEGTRVELRSPDPSCNPYLALAVILSAGMDGINNKIIPPDPIEQNLYDLNSNELSKLQIDTLPNNLDEALQELKKDVLIQNTLGEHVYQHFLEAKQLEWDLYRTQVHQWELDQYLEIF